MPLNTESAFLIVSEEPSVSDVMIGGSEPVSHRLLAGYCTIKIDEVQIMGFGHLDDRE
jgi:hypothetical protein